MFQRLAAQIRRLPWWGQAVAWPFYAVAYVVCNTAGWAITEMTGRAMRGTKKTVAPLLWPVFGTIVFFVALTTNSEPVRQLAGWFLVLAVLAAGFWVMLGGISRKKR